MLKQREIRKVVVSGKNRNLQDKNKDFSKKFAILGFYP